MTRVGRLGTGPTPPWRRAVACRAGVQSFPDGGPSPLAPAPFCKPTFTPGALPGPRLQAEEDRRWVNANKTFQAKQAEIMNNVSAALHGPTPAAVTTCEHATLRASYLLPTTPRPCCAPQVPDFKVGESVYKTRWMPPATKAVGN